MSNIVRRFCCVFGLVSVSVLWLPKESVASPPQSPVTVTCLNIETSVGEGPQHRYEICTPHGCFITRAVPGACPGR